LKIKFPTAQISKDLNYSQGVISQYINGKREMSENFRAEFEKFYNIKFSDFEDKNENYQKDSEILFSGYDKKINEIKIEIEELNIESKRLKEEDSEGNKKTIEHIKNIIDLNYQRIELILKAKIDQMKDDYEI